MPSDAATAGEGGLYDVELQALDDRTFHLRWHGRHAAAVLAALRQAHLTTGPVRQVEWGTYEIVLDGASTRRLIAAVIADPTWAHEPAQVVHRGAHPSDATELIELGTAADLLDDDRFYTLVVDVY